MKTEAMSDMASSLKMSRLFLLAVTSYLLHKGDSRFRVDQSCRVGQNCHSTYTMNQAMKKIPIANKTMVSCGYTAGLTGLTYLLMFSMTALDCSKEEKTGSASGLPIRERKGRRITILLAIPGRFVSV